MKNLLLLFCLPILFLTACNGKIENPEVQPPPIDEETNENTFVLNRCGIALFSQNDGLDNYYIALSNAATIIEDNQCKPAAEGVVLYLDLYSEPYSTENNTRIKEGEYSQSLSPKTGVWDINYSFALLTDEHLVSSELTFMIGKVTVKHSGNGYEISAALTDAKENKEYTFTYKSDEPIAFEPLGGEPEGLPTLDKDLNLTLTYGMGNHYLEDPLNKGYETVVLSLADAELDCDGKLTAPGTLVSLTLLTDFVPDKEFPILQEGTYTVNKENAIGSLVPGTDIGLYLDGSFCTNVTNEQSIQYGLFTEGSVTVSATLAGYEITLNLVTKEGKKVTGTYEGYFDLTPDSSGDITPDDDISQLESDRTIDLSGVEEGSAVYLGDIYFTGADVWKIKIAKTGGDAMIFELLTQTGDGYALPAGKYTPTLSYEAGTFMPGTLSISNEPEGTWFLDNLFEIPTPMAPAMDGWVNVKSEGGKYVLDFEFKDGASKGPFTFKGQWTGKLSIENQSIM